MLVQFRDAHLSLWQSSVDEVLHREARQAASAPSQWIPRTSLDDPGTAGDLMREATRHCEAIFNRHPIAKLVESAKQIEARLKLTSSGSLRDQLCYCSIAYLKLAEAIIDGNATAEAQYRAELAKFGNCDPRYATAMANYINYFRLAHKPIPYRSWKILSDYVDVLPDSCTIALIGDWGTGQQPARTVLDRVAARNPAIVIHMGDIYYSGTQYEADNYFLALFRTVFESAGRPMPLIYTLSGNHDMYSGGLGYYWLLDQIGQKASFFCLRNNFWNFVGVDTGVNDYDPFSVNTSTPSLKDTELTWLHDKIDTAGNARTVLLSHHPLFSVYERIDSQAINGRFDTQMKDLLPKITAWYWAHEHNLVMYENFQDIHARCIGHGAFPVAIGELGAPHPDVPFISNVHLGQDGDFYQHGYVIIELANEHAAADYYACDSSGKEQKLYSEQLEQLP